MYQFQPAPNQPCKKILVGLLALKLLAFTIAKFLPIACPVPVSNTSLFFLQTKADKFNSCEVGGEGSRGGGRGSVDKITVLQRMASAQSFLVKMPG